MVSVLASSVVDLGSSRGQGHTKDYKIDLVTVVKCVFHLTTRVHQINLCVWMVNVWVRDGFVIHRMIAMTTRMRTLIFVVSLNNFMVTHVNISLIFFLNSLKWFFDGSMEIKDNHHPWSWKSKWFVTYYNWRAVVPGENHQHAASHWQTLSHNVVSGTPCLSVIRTHNVSGDRHTLHR
jgi:hypothetical protein